MPYRKGISFKKLILVKGAASTNGKTYHTPDFITGRFGRPYYCFSKGINNC